MIRVLLLSVSLLALLSCGASLPAEDVKGVWAGELSIAGTTLAITVELEYQEDTLSGRIDSPQQNARGLELTNLSVRGDSVCFSLPSGLGRAGFRGVVQGETIAGAFSQAGHVGSFSLSRVSALIPEQVVEGEEIVITGEDCVIAGTLVLPEGEPPFPCVFLLSGSGQQDRDEYVMGFPVFAALTRHLAAEGIAVLRCDDRGVGGSSGGMDAFSDSVLLYEAGLMLEYLMLDQRIDTQKIGVLGHSEGSSTAFALAALRPFDVAFVVSMAGPAVNGYTTILDQQEAILRMQGFPDEFILGKQSAQTAIMDAVIAGDVAGVEPIIRQQFREELASLSETELALMGDVEAQMEMVVQRTMAEVSSPWFRGFLVHDPALSIAMVRCPVLVLFGGKDVQVSSELNLPVMEAALAGNPDHEIIVLDNANHLFQEAVSGAVEEYSTLPPEFIAGFPEAVSTWIRERVI